VPFNAQGVNEHFWKSECEKKTNPKEKKNLRKKHKIIEEQLWKV